MAVAIVTPAVQDNLGYGDVLHSAQRANAPSGRVVVRINGNDN